MRWIYISPHFDDAVLSCGGLIWEQTQQRMPVEIWTLHAGEPAEGPGSAMITRVHALWQTGTPRQTVTQRRQEDHNAATLVGAQLKHFSLIDAIYRRGPNGELLYQVDVFGEPHPQDALHRAEIAAQLAPHLTAEDMVVCPLALGEHVDHAATRQALEQIHSRICYYADIPYLFKHAESLAAAAKGMSAHHFDISPRALQHWHEAICAHKSQISSLFEDEADMRRQIEAYVYKNQGLYLYRRD